MINYRPLQKRDIAQIQALALEAWLFTNKKIYSTTSIKKWTSDYYSKENFKKTFTAIKNKKGFFIVAEEAKKIIGYAEVGKVKEWELFRIYISPHLIGKGLGARLLEHIEQFLKKKNAKSYIAYPHIKNRLAKRFYLKKGFKRNHKKDSSATSICYEKQLN